VKILGIMSLNYNSETSYFTEMAKRASKLGITCFRFIPSQIHPISQKVVGKIFNSQSNAWEQEELDIPNILYDRCFYSDDTHSKQCASIVSWLKNREDIYFLGYGLPNKLELYNVLKQSPLEPYLPPTKLITDSSLVIYELNNHRRIVLKPINGSQGNGIFFINKQGQTIIVKTFNKSKHIQKEFHNEKILLKWVNTLIANKDYFIQPYLELTNQKDEPYDIRAFLQKNENGNWAERGRGIRIGSSEGILSNLSAGGRIESANTWKNHFSFYQSEFIHSEIDDILSKIPNVLEDSFLPLFELGVDIGVAKTGSIWILDINSKPGRKVILQTNPENEHILYNAPILYGRSLFKTEKLERKRYDAKTLSH
jgi:glutathione synthase/RimK-type ligase-like ATP-grasp enzyme